jgi:hypothetical protein
LPAAARRSAGFDAVIHGIADHVQQRIVQFLHHAPIQFRVLATGLELDFFLLLGADVAGDAGHFLENPADGHHAHGHAHPLKLLGDAAQLGHVPHQLRIQTGQLA